jgi:hypothetical protein
MILTSVSSDIGPVTWPEAVTAVAFFTFVAFVVWCLTRWNS